MKFNSIDKNILKLLHGKPALTNFITNSNTISALVNFGYALHLVFSKNLAERLSVRIPSV